MAPNLPGLSATIAIMVSLHAFTKRLVKATSPKNAPGDAIDISTASMPFSSINSSWRSKLQAGHGFSPLPSTPTVASSFL